MIIHVCDNCRKEIPVVKKVIYGFEREVLDVGHITLEQAPDFVANYLTSVGELCKDCAKMLSSQLDYELLKVKTQHIVSTNEKNKRNKNTKPVKPMKKDDNHVDETTNVRLADKIPFVNPIRENANSGLHSRWEINCDGYYPYCLNCLYEPSREEGLPEICPKCRAIMDNKIAEKHS